MTRAAWQGYITLGQLGIPVRLYTAVQSIQPRFVQLHETDGSPVERQLRCKAEQREISSSEVVRAVEVEPDRYVTLTDRELDSGHQNDFKAITIQQFCDNTDIQTLYVDKPYYVVPTRGGERAYSLVREVLARLKKIAIAQFVIYNRAHIAALGVVGDLLMLQQLRYADEIVPRQSIRSPALPKPSPNEIEALSQVVELFSGPFFIQDYRDTFADNLHGLIERKKRGLSPKRTERERIAPHATPEKDILVTLQESLHKHESSDTATIELNR
jgi:DNA end-binding protein Ku